MRVLSSSFVALLSVLGLGVLSPSASAQNVVLTGILGDKALVSIDGYAPVMLHVGQARQNIELIKVDAQRHAALVRIDNSTRELRLGATPSTIGGGGGGSKEVLGGQGRSITLSLGSDSHYYAEAYINEDRIRFMVDAEASDIALSQDDANRLDLSRLQRGDMATLKTPHGPYLGERVTVGRLRVGEVEMQNISVIIVPKLPIAILGQSFLKHFKSQKVNDMLLLERLR